MKEPRESGATVDAGRTRLEDVAFAHSTLPRVSRTFARAIEILPPSLGEPVRLSYLLCRTADTMEDAAGIRAPTRRAWLLRLGSLLSTGKKSRPERAATMPAGSDDPVARGPVSCVALVSEVAAALRPDSPERELVEGLPRLLRLLEATDSTRRAIIERWTSELVLGMARFVSMEEEGAGWTALQTCEDLDAYEYYVAGTVGCLLDEMIDLEIGPQDPASRTRRRRLAVAFGLGLQGTNILQDLSDDRTRGWCYIPEEIATRHGTATARLHDPAQRTAGRAIIREMSDRAVRHLDSGIEFVLLLPRRHPRIRLFCLWPLLLAVRTLTRLAADDSLLERRVKISREEVNELTREATWRCISNSALRKLYEGERNALHTAMRTAEGMLRQ
jgi:farnesyl-diphosphate farnesyltransferase